MSRLGRASQVSGQGADSQRVNRTRPSHPGQPGYRAFEDARAAGSAAQEAARLSAALEVLEVPSAAGPDLDAVLEVERVAAVLGRSDLLMRGRLVRARHLLGEGSAAAAARLIWDVNKWATDNGDRAVLAASHRHLVWLQYLLGDPAAGLDHAVRAMELLDDTTPPRERVHHLMTLARALGWARSLEGARERAHEAEQVLASDGTPDSGGVYLLLCLLGNLSGAEHAAGEYQRSWELAERMIDVAAARDFHMNVSFQHVIAVAQAGLGRYAEAEGTLHACIDSVADNPNPDGLAESLLTLAEVQRHLGDTDRAQATLSACREACDADGLTDMRVRAQREQAELYAATGQYQRAFEAYKKFHVDAEQMHSLERSAQARTRQAVLETTEARQQAERFREQARRDPLTGLRNRRFVDEELPALLDEAERSGTPLSLAFVDLDHFKGINDSLSHDVGDQVLILVAGLITSAIEGPAGDSPAPTESGFAARMGGDEFLVVLPGLDPAQVAHRLEEVSRAVASYPWKPVTGVLPVTVSIGGAAARPGEETIPELLGRADQNLYAAKGTGRNRVATDGPHLPIG